MDQRRGKNLRALRLFHAFRAVGDILVQRTESWQDRHRFNIVALVVHPHGRSHPRHETDLAAQPPEFALHAANIVRFLVHHIAAFDHHGLRIFRAESVERKFLAWLQRHGIAQAPDGLGAQGGQARQLEALGLTATGDNHFVAFAHAARLDHRTGFAHLVETDHPAIGIFRHLCRLDNFHIGAESLDHKFLLVRREELRTAGRILPGRDGAAKATGLAVEHHHHPLLKDRLRSGNRVRGRGGSLRKKSGRAEKPGNRHRVKAARWAAINEAALARDWRVLHQHWNW